MKSQFVISCWFKKFVLLCSSSLLFSSRAPRLNLIVLMYAKSPLAGRGEGAMGG